METINIQFQVPSTGQYTLDEFVAKLKDYAEKLASSISKSGNSYQETVIRVAQKIQIQVILIHCMYMSDTAIVSSLIRNIEMIWK